MGQDPQQILVDGETCTVGWRAQPGPQQALLQCPTFEALYGGARGGGKTDAMLGEWALHAQRYGQHAIGRMFRRERTQLMETIARAMELYAPLHARWKEVDKTFIFPNGARLAFAYLERDADAEAYQGASFTRIYVEEIGNFPDAAPVKKLMATLRSAQGVPCRFRATANPGGPGHSWVKARYIDPAPGGYEIIVDPDTGLERVYIPARIIDNPALLNNDPSYVARLRSVGSDQLVRAWLDGDWDIVEGAYFDNWSAARHVIRPCELPAHWTRFRAIDWGSARPFSVGWYAVSDGMLDAFPAGALIHYREWYGMAENRPNVGVKMDVEAVAAGILERDGGDVIKYGIADPSIFASDGGPSIAERFYRQGVLWRRGDNKRVPGWQQVRARLNGEDGRPMLYVFSTCAHLIRTLPALQHDEHRPEDVDCWVAGTSIATPDGPRPIERVRAGDMVDTPVGPRPVLRSYHSGPSETVRVLLSDGRLVEGTPHHKIYIRGKGLVALEHLRCYDVPKARNTWQSAFSIAAWCTHGMMAVSTITPMARSWRRAARACIARCGWTQVASFQMAGTFITSTATTITTASAISSVSPAASTLDSICESDWQAATSMKRLRRGEAAMPARLSFATMRARCASTLQNAHRRAAIVKLCSLLDIPASVSVRLGAMMQPALNRWSPFAPSAPSRSGLGSIRRGRCKPARIVVVGRFAVRKPVYNITVADAHMFYANGVLSSNTEGEDHAADSLRYGCMSRPYAAPAPEDNPTRWPHEMTMDELIKRQVRRHGEGARL